MTAILKSILLGGMLAAQPPGAAARDHPPLVTAILIYNGFPDSPYKLGLQVEPGPVPNGIIALPSSLLRLPFSRAEAAALVAAAGAYMTPDIRRKPRTQLDRAARLARLLQAMESCPGAMASVDRKLRDADPVDSLAAMMQYIRSERIEFAVAPDPDCSRHRD